MMETENKPVEKKKGSPLIGCLSLIVIVIAVISIISSLGGDSEPKPEHDEAAAAIRAQYYVQEQLKSPGSAKFAPGGQQMVLHLGDGRYLVEAWVDSQNSFGALIRTEYSCNLKYIGDDKWELEDLEFVK